MKFPFFVLSFLLICSCKKSSIVDNSENISDYQLKYARNIELKESNSTITIRFPSIHKYVEIDKNDMPITACYVMNTSSVAYINSLGKLDAIKGVASPNYIYNSKLQGLISNKKVEILGNDTGWDFEKLIKNNVKFIFCNYNPAFEATYLQLRRNGYYIIYIDEFLESSPLGRSEYLKIFGELFHRQELANEIFEKIESNYTAISKKSSNIKDKPKLLSKIMYGDIWFMPEGESYSATLYTDAGGDYPWQNTLGNSSLNLSFEEVFSKDSDADVWIDVSDIANANQLLAQNTGYSNFKAFQKGNLFSIIGRKNGQANDFYETGVVYADSVLSEINYIFRNYKNINPDSLIYYKKIN